jgi:hypothetical protein
MLSDPVLPCARSEKEVMCHSSIFFLGTWNRNGKLATLCWILPSEGKLVVGAAVTPEANHLNHVLTDHWKELRG